MSRRIEKNPNAHSLTRQVRGIVTSLAIPSILTACAPAPHIHSVSGQTTGSAKTILYVAPRGKQGGEEYVVAEEAKDSDPSPANQYIPLSSDVSIFEKILQKYQIPPDPPNAAVQKDQPAASVKSKSRPSRQLVGLNSPPAGKSLKDGIWDRMRKRLMLTGIEQERIVAEVDKIKRSPGGLSFLSKRAEPFLFYIVDEIERRGLPMDLAMVPMVESGFQPAAVSPKQAAGIWQFIPGTATDYGLKLVDGYDGRYDIYASTKAALKYLARLQGLFGGDWLLALAAYNAGEGAVQRAVAANQKAGLPTSFWDLELPAETKAYVPKILALSRVVADPAAHGVNLHRISSLPYLARVEVNGETVQLAQAVAGAGMSWEEFYGLNPAFKPDVAPTAPFNLLLPLDKAQMLAANLPGARLVAARKYVVKKGETLVVIAKQQGVPPLKLAEWNGLKTDSRVKAGQELIIYPV